MNDATSTIAVIISYISGTSQLVLGAILAIGGGWIGDVLRARGERQRELEDIKIVLRDELGSIEKEIKTMHETWTQSNILYPTYISNLNSNTASFDHLRLRLFLIRDEKLRGEIHAFYKKFKDLLRKSEGKVGTLAETTEAKDEQKKIHDEFEKIRGEAEAIKNKLVKPTTL